MAGRHVDKALRQPTSPDAKNEERRNQWSGATGGSVCIPSTHDAQSLIINKTERGLV